MNSRKKLLAIGCAVLALLVLALILLQMLPSSDEEGPMEEEDLLAYLAEQREDGEAEQTQDLFWEPEPEAAD